MLVFIFIFLILSADLYSQQLFRSSYGLQEGASVLYRIEDREALAEIKVIYNSEREFIPSRFILETENIQFGSLKAAGMWKFIEMDTLINSAALKESPGLKADRSTQNALQNPGAAYFIPDKGGILCISSENLIKSSLWASFVPGNYTSVNTGISLVLPDPEPDDISRGDWYADTGINQYTPLYHGVSDFRREGDKTSIRFLAGMSAASLRVAGFSILPSLDYYGSFWDLSSRLWFNSQRWLNSNLERSDSWFHSENLFTMKLNPAVHTLLKWSCDADFIDNTPMTHGLQCRADMIFGHFPVLLEYILLPPDYSNYEENNSSIYRHSYRVQGGWNGAVWSCRVESAFIHDKTMIQKITNAAEVKRAVPKGRCSRLRCTHISEPGYMSIKPVYEESFSLGDFRFKISGGYEFKVPSQSYEIESLNLSVSMEWKGN